MLGWPKSNYDFFLVCVQMEDESFLFDHFASINKIQQTNSDTVVV